MSDLQCAARVFVARHGEADYESELLSDAGGSLSALGREPGSPRTWSRIPFRPIFDDWLDGRLETQIPGGESGSQVVERVCGVLDEAADRYRGEAVLVIGHGGAICAAVPQLVRNLDGRFPQGRPLGNGAVVELAADADGWIARRWAGEAVPR